MTESATGPGQASEPSTRPLPVFSFPRCGRAWLTHIWFHYALALTVTEHLFPEGPPTLQRPNDDPRFQDFVVPRLLQAGLRPLQFRHGFTIEKGQRDLIEKVQTAGWRSFSATPPRLWRASPTA